MSRVPMALPDGPKVRRLRLSNGWTQQELADRIGRTQEAMSKVESGKPVSHVLMRQVARSLKVKLGEIAVAIPGGADDGPAEAEGAEEAEAEAA